MTPDQFTTALTTLGLDNHQAAQWLGVSVKSVRRYRVSGAPKMAERLLRIATDVKEAETYNCYLGASIGWAACIKVQDLVPSLALDWRE